jgi:hypothetical protein
MMKGKLTNRTSGDFTKWSILINEINSISVDPDCYETCSKIGERKIVTFHTKTIRLAITSETPYTMLTAYDVKELIEKAEHKKITGEEPIYPTGMYGQQEKEGETYRMSLIRTAMGALISEGKIHFEINVAETAIKYADCVIKHINETPNSNI